MQSGMALGTVPTKVSPQVGGTFTIFSGHIVGRHIELVPNEKIVQAWRVVDWDPSVYSIARFELVEQGSGTKIVFDHAVFRKDKRNTWLKDGRQLLGTAREIPGLRRPFSTEQLLRWRSSFLD
jgi:hypothetical protein